MNQASFSEPTPKLGELDLQGGGWRWPQFGLRTMLLVVLLIAVPLGWTAWRAVQARRQQAVLERLAPFGAQAGWLSGGVVQLTFRGDGFRDEALAMVAELPRLQRLVLIDTQVTGKGLSHLIPAELKQLKILRAPQLGDDARTPLGGLVTLESLWLEETGVGDEAVAGLTGLRQLQSASFIGSPVGDDGLQALARLPQLRKVYLQRTDVTPAGVDELSRELPKATIAF